MVDETGTKHYLATMLGRILLTLLAILTGFAAQATPAEARLLAERSAEFSPIATNAGETCKSVTDGRAVHTVRARQDLLMVVHDRFWAGIALFPAVLTGIDRARE